VKDVNAQVFERTAVHFAARPHQVVDAKNCEPIHVFEEMPRQATPHKPANAGDGDFHGRAEQIVLGRLPYTLFVDIPVAKAQAADMRDSE
jgi:hypothetical protein